MYTASIKLPAALTETDVTKLSGALADIAQAYVALREGNNDNGPWVLNWIIENPVTGEDLLARFILQAALGDIPAVKVTVKDWNVEKIPDDIDWLEHSYKQFSPFSIGSFFIYGSHFDGNVPTGQIGLQIDAVTAFGSGEHGTTAGCLLAMLELKNRGVCPWNVLDMGTGSGILAIGAWKLWKTPVLAVDNDTEAIRVATRHAQANSVPLSATSLHCEQGDGFVTKCVKARAPFDLIIANILSGPLQEMAEDLKAVLDENGYVVLSGISVEHAEDVLKSYDNLVLKKRCEIDGWATLVLQNTAA